VIRTPGSAASVADRYRVGPRHASDLRRDRGTRLFGAVKLAPGWVRCPGFGRNVWRAPAVVDGSGPATGWCPRLWAVAVTAISGLVAVVVPRMRDKQAYRGFRDLLMDVCMGGLAVKGVYGGVSAAA
jgi:hypothetical protein